MDQVDEFKVKGEEVLGRIRELVAEGNVRKVTITNAEGKLLIEVPLTIGVVGALVAPVAAAIGAVAALLTECTISVTRADEAEPEPEGEPEAGEE